MPNEQPDRKNVADFLRDMETLLQNSTSPEAAERLKAFRERGPDDIQILRLLWSQVEVNNALLNAMLWLGERMAGNAPTGPGLRDALAVLHQHADAVAGTVTGMMGREFAAGEGPEQ